jgi:hypothetical protein
MDACLPGLPGGQYPLKPSDQLRWIGIGARAGCSVRWLIGVSLAANPHYAAAFVYLAVVAGVLVATGSIGVSRVNRTRDLYRLRNAYRSMSPEDQKALVELGPETVGKSVSPSGQTPDMVRVPAAPPLRDRSLVRFPLALTCSGEGQDRTADTAVFSRVLCQLSYLAWRARRASIPRSPP